MRRILAATLSLVASLTPFVFGKGASTAHLAPNAKVFLEPMSGFEADLAAAIIQKHVPVIMVDDAKRADYVIAGSNEVVRPGWAKTILVSPQPADHASITVKDQAGTIVFAYTWDSIAARRGAQSAAEGIAKHLKQNIEAR